MLRQQSAAVLPIVHWGVSIHVDGNQGSGTLDWYIENKGVGPAQIEQGYFWYDNRYYP